MPAATSHRILVTNYSNFDAAIDAGVRVLPEIIAGKLGAAMKELHTKDLRNSD